MNIRKCFQVKSLDQWSSLALLFLRLVVGIAFILHGWGKIQAPFSWMPAQAPISIPGIFQFLAALAEFGGGIAFILGLIMPLASLGMSATMVVAVYFHAVVLKDPFVSSGGASYEPSLGYLAISLALLAIGPGRYALDKYIFGEK